jgi:hypothetical protein
MRSKIQIHRWRVVLLSVVVLILVVPYGLSLATHYIDSNVEQTIDFKDQAPLDVSVTVRKAMYLGSSYNVAVRMTAVSRYFNPEMFEEPNAYKVYASRVLDKARCRLDAPDYSVVEVKPKSEVASITIIEQRGTYTPDVWECSFVVSPKVSGSPMLLVGVTNISGFESWRSPSNVPLFVPMPTNLHDMHLPLNVPVEERLSLTAVSAPLAIVVALAGLFIKGKSDQDDAAEKTE